MRSMHCYPECSSDPKDLVTVSLKVKKTHKHYRCRNGQHFFRFQCSAFGHIENVFLIVPGKISPKTAGMKNKVPIARDSLSTKRSPGAKDNAQTLTKSMVVETNRMDALLERHSNDDN